MSLAQQSESSQGRSRKLRAAVRLEQLQVVGIRRPNGTCFVTEFFQCAGCSVMFTNPAEFSRLTRDTYTGNWRERKPTREYLPDSDGQRKKEDGESD